MNRRRRHLLFAALLALSGLAAGSALAIRPDEVLSDPKLEARARAIGQELRCLVCQNESIDDSDADLAHDLRLLVRRRLLAGDSDEQVKQYLVARYGTYVLLKPPFDWETLLLWAGPALLLCAGGFGAMRFYRRGVAPIAPAAPLSAQEDLRLAALLDEKGLGSP
jgi:cytochrome c-type biogenesis protein CcmH